MDDATNTTIGALLLYKASYKVIEAPPYKMETTKAFKTTSCIMLPTKANAFPRCRFLLTKLLQFIPHGCRKRVPLTIFYSRMYNITNSTHASMYYIQYCETKVDRCFQFEHCL